MRERGKLLSASAATNIEAAREARLSAVRLLRWGRRCGLSCNEVAHDLGVNARTLRSWEQRWRLDRLEARRLGRRARRELTRDQRQGVLWALHRTSGRIGVNELMNVVWPSATRVAITDIKARWRYAAHRRGGRLCGLVHWTRAGSVWAMDWTDPDHALEGGYEKILSVRDLASGTALLALPTAAESGEAVARELRRLVERHGAPAVLKEDNGRSLRCQSVELVLGYYGILALTSPPACPGYNGACEAGIGALKVVVGEMAAACGRDRAWTCDDVDNARRRVNERPKPSGLSADDAWRARRPIGERERERLWNRYRTHEAAERTARGIELRAPLSRLEQASLDRRAIARALEEEGLVCFRRRWIRPPIRGRKVSRKR